MKPEGDRPRNLFSPIGKASFWAWAWLLAFLLGLFHAQSAFAQAVLGKPERLIITPSMSIAGNYDTNINQDPFDEIEDYSTIYSPGATIIYRLPYTNLSANYVWNFEEYDDLEELNNMNESGSGSISHIFNPYLSFFGGVNYSKSESESVDLDLNVLGRLAESARSRQSSESIGADALIQLGYLARLPLSLTYSFQDNLASASDEVDKLSHTFGASTTYLVDPERGHRINVGYTASITEENRNTQRAPSDPALNFAANNLTEHAVNVSYTHVFDPTLSATGGGGISWASHASDPRLENEIEPTYFASLTKRWTRTGINLNWALDTGRGGGFAGTTTSQTVGLLVDHTPRPNIGLALNLNLAEDEIENSASGLDREDLRYLINPSVSYRFFRYVTLSGSYTYSRNELDDVGGTVSPDSEFQELVASLSLILKPEFPQFNVSYSFSTNDSENNDDDFDREVLLFSVTYSFSFGL